MDATIMEQIMAGSLAAAVGVIGYTVKKVISHDRAIAKIEATMVTKDEVTEIVRKEVEPISETNTLILDQVKKNSERFEKIATAVDGLAIKTAVLEALKEKG